MANEEGPANHLWFSADAEAGGCSLNKARTTDGEVVVYTCATRDRSGKAYLWDDKRYVGELAEWLEAVLNGFTYHTEKLWRTKQ